MSIALQKVIEILAQPLNGVQNMTNFYETFVREKKYDEKLQKCIEETVTWWHHYPFQKAC